MPALRIAYVRFLADHDCAERDGEFDLLNGPSLPEIVASLREGHHLGAPHNVLLATYQSLVAEAYSDVRPSPGAEELLRAARIARWSTAVVTSNTSQVAQAWLDRTGLAPLIDHVVGGEMVLHGKPSPDLYLAALAMGASPKYSVAVEDSRQGVEAALSAGLRTFLLDGNASGKSDAGVPGIAGVVNRLDELVDLLF